MDEKSTVRAFPSFSSAVAQKDAADLGLARGGSPHRPRTLCGGGAGMRPRRTCCFTVRRKAQHDVPGDFATRSIAIVPDAAWAQIRAVRL
jgi:hypothetical protein